MLLLVGRNILYMSHFPSVRSKWVDIWLLHHFSHGPTLKIPFLGPSLVPNPTELLATQANIAQVLSCMCMDRDKLAKKRSKQSQYSATLTGQAWSIKDLLYGFWGNVSCRTWHVVLSRQDSSILLQ